MKVIFYMATSINGCIADKNGETPWSEEDNQGFQNICNNKNAVIMGRNTYNGYLEVSEGWWPNKTGTNVVLTSKNIPQNSKFNVVLKTSTKDCIDFYANKGKEEVVIIGGNQIWEAFAKDEYFDELFIDIEPLLFGKGINLFSNVTFDKKLELLEVNKLSEQTIQLHYKVVK